MMEAQIFGNSIWYIDGDMHTLINKSNIKKYALHVADCHRPFAGFTRVSGQFFDRIEGKLRLLIEAEIRALPSKGVTIK